MNASAHRAAPETSRSASSLRVLARVPCVDNVRTVAPDPPATEPQLPETKLRDPAALPSGAATPVANPAAATVESQAATSATASPQAASPGELVATIQRWQIDPKQWALGIAAAAAVFVLLLNTHGRRHAAPNATEHVAVAPAPPEIALPEPSSQPMLPSLPSDAGPSFSANDAPQSTAPSEAPAIAGTAADAWTPPEAGAATATVHADEGPAVAAANSAYDLTRQPGAAAPVAEVTAPVARVTARPESTPSEAWGGGGVTNGGFSNPPPSDPAGAGAEVAQPPPWGPSAGPAGAAPPPVMQPGANVPTSSDPKVKRIRNPYQAQARIPRPPLPTAEPTQPGPTGAEMPVYRVAERPDAYATPSATSRGARIEGVRPVQPQPDGTERVGDTAPAPGGGQP